MHELALMRDMVDAIEERVREAARGRQVRRVVLEVGRVSGVLPDALRFCFDSCVRGSVADGAELEIREIPGRALCRSCGADFDFDLPFGLCRCGSADLSWVTGRELRLRELEVA